MYPPVRMLSVPTPVSPTFLFASSDPALLVALEPALLAFGEQVEVVLSLEAALDSIAENPALTLAILDTNLQGMKRTPSRQITEQLAFTPFVFEEVGNLIDQSNPDLYLFSTDYPHVEGGRNPIARFEGSLGEREAAVRDKFYADNFLRLFPGAA